VQILDPATGTGTFLVEAIDVIHRTMAKRWDKQGHMALEFPNLWNEYVPKHLLPRLHGYELLMAPYAIAHMKIGLKLFETGYRFGSDERARIYLTNALEPANNEKKQRQFEDWAPALAHEAQAVNAIKAGQCFTVVIGNPPYSGISANLADDIRRIIDPYRFVDGVRIKEKSALQFEKNLNDDYVKFFRFAEMQLEGEIGVLGLITNNGFQASATLRGMRNRLLQTFDVRWLVDLHGDADMRERDELGRVQPCIFHRSQDPAL
jgi:predicted helicase